MSFDDQRIPFPARCDYGPRAGWPTLAVTWHMAEGRNDAAVAAERERVKAAAIAAVEAL